MEIHEVDPGPARGVLAARLGIGLAQGLALYGLSRLVEGEAPHPWVSANPKGFGLLVLLAALLPLPLLLGLGQVRGRVLAVWVAAAGGLILALGGYDLRQYGEATMTPASAGLILGLGAMLFVGHALVAAGDAGRRLWPRYPDCFEAAWKAGLQLVLAGCFVGGFWIIYGIGTQLFLGIGIEALSRLGGRAAFVLPVTTALGAAGIHLADAGPRLTLGLRNLLLGLKGWLTPVLAGLTAAFLLALPFTGLEVLRERDDGFGWLVVAAGGLVVLVSAVHGDGRAAAPAVLRLSARVAAVILPVLVVLAGWTLARKIGAEGLTQGRVVGVAALAVIAVHAVAYPVAALLPSAGPGMRLLEPANIAAAMLALPVIAALNTPLADAGRLEVRSQVERLRRGAVPPEDFNFDRLGRTGRDGRRALEALAGDPDPAIARRAELAVLSSYDRMRERMAAPDARPRLRALPDGTALPPGLAEAMRTALPECLAEECVARAAPPAGREAWLVGPIHGGFWAMVPDDALGWRHAETFEAQYACRAEARAGLIAGEARVVPPALPDLALGEVILRPSAVARKACR